MLMDEGMDTGAMLLHEAIPIEPVDTSGTLSERLSQVGARLLIETLTQLKAGRLKPISQDHSQATTAPIIKKEDGLIDWNLGARAIANRVRGFNPWPTAYTYTGSDRWTIWQTVPLTETAKSNIPGTVVRSDKSGIVVQCGDGLLAVTSLQVPGGRRLTAGEYLAGHPVALGLRLGSPPVSTVVS